MARRDRVTGTPPPPPPESTIHRCQSCGVGLQMARRQAICSWCKGDPDYGKDGYFNDIVDDFMQRVAPPEMTRAMVVDMLVADRKAVSNA